MFSSDTEIHCRANEYLVSVYLDSHQKPLSHNFNTKPNQINKEYQRKEPRIEENSN
jgi:hypothetical protein